MQKIELYGLSLPRLDEPADLEMLLATYLRAHDLSLQNGDLLVITSKYVQKAKGLVVRIADVQPGRRAKWLSKLTGKPAVEVQMILDASRRVLFFSRTDFMAEHLDALGHQRDQAEAALAGEQAVLFTVSKNGFITTDSGLDYSNVPPGYAVVNAYDFDRLAEEIKTTLRERCGAEIAVVITDTEFTFSNGKFGSMDFAVGSAGLAPLSRAFGAPDLYGRPKFGGLDLVVDEVSAAAALLMKQSAEGVPAVLLRGLTYERSDEGVQGVLFSQYGKTARRVFWKNIALNVLGKLLRLT